MTQIIAIDTETELIRQGLLAPPLVCVSICRDGLAPELYRWDQAKQHVVEAFTLARQGRAIITGQKFAYDAAVMMVAWPDMIPLIFEAYDADAIEDTLLREKLIDLAMGDLGYHSNDYGDRIKVGYSLAAIAHRRLDRSLDKGDDGWRMRYGDLMHVPLTDWPERASSYAKEDARTTHDVYRHQAEESARLAEHYPDLLFDSPAQSRALLALHLMSCRGMITDAEKVAALEKSLRATLEDRHRELGKAGLLNAKGGLLMAAIKDRVVAALGDDAPETDKGNIKCSADILNQIDDPALKIQVAYKKTQKKLTTYVEKLWKGTTGPIQPKINSLLETGRTSMSGWEGMHRKFKGFSLQTLPRSGGVRECFVPRRGFEYVDTDYSAAELRALGQVMLNLFGASPMAELFQENPEADPHMDFAAHMMGIDPGTASKKNPEHKKFRQDAKAGNFGFPGGMGVDRFVAEEKRKYYSADPIGSEGGLYTHDRAKELREAYKERWGMQRYFDHAGQCTGWGNGTAQSFVSKRYRGGCRFTDFANDYFQSLTADANKAALWDLAKEMYLPRGRLAGCYLVNFIHDETLIEAPKGTGIEVGRMVSEIMVAAMMRYTPDVPAIAEPQVMDCWQKG